MKIGKHSLSAVLLTLAFVATALVIGSAGQAALAVPAPQVAAALPPQAANAAAAGDVTPPTEPGGVRPCPPPLAPTVPTGYASICWTPSNDDTGVVGYDIYELTSAGFVYRTTTTSTIGGFSGVYGRLYTMYVSARDAAGNVSLPSQMITTVATLGMTPTISPSPVPDDIAAPTKPTGLTDGCLADYPGVAFCWQPSTDNVGVAAYDLYRKTATTYLKVGTRTASAHPSFTESGLETGKRYLYFVVARDAADNLSLPSDSLSALAREGLPTGTCTVTYRATTWTTGLSAEITIRNTGTTTIDGWTLAIDYASPAPRLASGWSATWTQDGTRISGAHLQWNKTIPAGTATQVGFNAAHGGTATAPVKVSLNGATCLTG